MINPDWNMKPLGELFAIGSGKTMSAAARNHPDKTPFLRTKNVLWDKIDLETLDEMHLTDKELREKSLKKGDLLVCEGGAIGRAAVWTGGPSRISFQNHLHRLRKIDPEVEPRFYVYFLQSAFTQLGIFEGAGNKTTIANLSKNRLLALDVPHPKLGEQKEVVVCLSKVREAINFHDRSVSVASELKQAAMRELFTRGLRGEAQKETKFGPIPESWDLVPIGEIARVGNGSTPKKSTSAYWENGTFPWLNSAKVYDRDIKSGAALVSEEALRRCHLPILEPDTVLVAITGQGKTLGHVGLLKIRATINQHLAYIALEDVRCIPEFMRSFLESQYSYFRQVGSGGGSTKGALTCGFLKSHSVPLPKTIAEQQDITEVLAAIDAKIDLHKRKRDMLEDLFKSLLHKLMTGEVRVSELNLSALDDLDQSEVSP